MTPRRYAGAPSPAGVPTATRGNVAGAFPEFVGVEKPEIPLTAGGVKPIRQSRFVERTLARLEAVQPLPVDVGGHHLVAGEGQPGDGNGPHVSQANDRYFHGSSSNVIHGGHAPELQDRPCHYVAAVASIPGWRT